MRKRAQYGTGCPVCLNKKVGPSNALTTTHPDLVTGFWDDARNGPLRPDQVSASYGSKVWWSCPEASDHVWERSVASMVKGQACPYCLGRSPSSTSSLAALRPDLAAQWREDNDLTPDEVVPGSNRSVGWRCPEGHEWEAQVQVRARVGYGCPFCSGHRVASERSLSHLRPDLVDEWDPENSLKPDDVTLGSNQRVTWVCTKGHRWDSSVATRVSSSGGCQRCAGRVLSESNSLAVLHPTIAAQWHPTKNGGLAPSDVVAISNQDAWWRCAEDPQHEWRTAISNRVRGTGCPDCARRSVWRERAAQKIESRGSLADLRPALAEQWDHERNELGPDQVLPSSNKTVAWRCVVQPDLHRWTASINGRSDACPFCSGKRVASDNSLTALHPALAAEWHPTRNGDLCPEDVRPGSKRAVWWLCAAHPEHEWEQTVQARVQTPRCQFCAGRRACSTTSLAALHPEVASEWHPTANGDLTPADVTPGSATRVTWQCRDHAEHVWEAPVRRRTRQASGCPLCRNPGWSLEHLIAWLAAHPRIASCGDRARQIEALRKAGVGHSAGRGRGLLDALQEEAIDPEDLRLLASGTVSAPVEIALAEHDPRRYGGRPHVGEEARERLYARDGHRCQNPHCDSAGMLPSRTRLTLDHKVPLVRGGKHHPSNWTTLCQRCNCRKSARTLAEFILAEQARQAGSAA